MSIENKTGKSVNEKQEIEDARQNLQKYSFHSNEVNPFFFI